MDSKQKKEAMSDRNQPTGRCDSRNHYHPGTSKPTADKNGNSEKTSESCRKKVQVTSRKVGNLSRPKNVGWIPEASAHIEERNSTEIQNSERGVNVYCNKGSDVSSELTQDVISSGAPQTPSKVGGSEYLRSLWDIGSEPPISAPTKGNTSGIPLQSNVPITNWSSVLHQQEERLGKLNLESFSDSSGEWFGTLKKSSEFHDNSANCVIKDEKNVEVQCSLEKANKKSDDAKRSDTLKLKRDHSVKQESPQHSFWDYRRVVDSRHEPPSSCLTKEQEETGSKAIKCYNKRHQSKQYHRFRQLVASPRLTTDRTHETEGSAVLKTDSDKKRMPERNFLSKPVDKKHFKEIMQPLSVTIPPLDNLNPTLCLPTSDTSDTGSSEPQGNLPYMQEHWNQYSSAVSIQQPSHLLANNPTSSSVPFQHSFPRMSHPLSHQIHHQYCPGHPNLLLPPVSLQSQPQFHSQPFPTRMHLQPLQTHGTLEHIEPQHIYGQSEQLRSHGYMQSHDSLGYIQSSSAVRYVQPYNVDGYAPPHSIDGYIQPTGTVGNIQLSGTAEYVQPYDVSGYVQPSGTAEYLQPYNVGGYIHPYNVGGCVQPYNVGGYVQPYNVGGYVHPHSSVRFAQSFGDIGYPQQHGVVRYPPPHHLLHGAVGYAQPTDPSRVFSVAQHPGAYLPDELSD